MRMPVRAAIAASVLAFGLSPVTTSASTIVFGDGWAHDCAVRAITGLSDPRTLEVCSFAIEQDTLSDNDYAKTLVNRGVVLMRRASLDAAAHDFDKAQQVAPKLPEIYVNRGVALMKRKDYAAAVSQIDKGIALNPDELEKAYFDRAIAKEGVGDVKGAYFDYVKASELKPDWDAPKHELTRFNVQKAGA